MPASRTLFAWPSVPPPLLRPRKAIPRQRPSLRSTSIPMSASTAATAHLLIVRAPYYRAVVDGLTDGAQRLLREAGATFETLDIAGAYELPQAIRIAVRGTTHFDGFVALGCVVRGETDHYNHICREAMRGADDRLAAVRPVPRQRAADRRIRSSRPKPAPPPTASTKAPKPPRRPCGKSAWPADRGGGGPLMRGGVVGRKQARPGAPPLDPAKGRCPLHPRQGRSPWNPSLGFGEGWG